MTLNLEKYTHIWMFSCGSVNAHLTTLRNIPLSRDHFEVEAVLLKTRTKSEKKNPRNIHRNIEMEEKQKSQEKTTF